MNARQPHTELRWSELNELSLLQGNRVKDRKEAADGMWIKRGRGIARGDEQRNVKRGVSKTKWLD